MRSTIAFIVMMVALVWAPENVKFHSTNNTTMNYTRISEGAVAGGIAGQKAGLADDFNSYAIMRSLERHRVGR